jgi:hypothetical protein
MRKLITALAATAAILTAGSIVSQAEATPATGIGSLAKSSSLIENVACCVAHTDVRAAVLITDPIAMAITAMATGRGIMGIVIGTRT